MRRTNLIFSVHLFSSSLNSDFILLLISDKHRYFHFQLYITSRLRYTQDKIMKQTLKKPDQLACIPREIMLRSAMRRLENVDDEIRAGYNIIRKEHKTVTIFGSARTPEGHPDYEAARKAANRLAKEGYTIVTGGGRGIMEAANRGAIEAGGESIGFNIVLPHEQQLNPYTTKSLAFSHFSPRKIVMTLFADAYIYFPGGFGTLDELSEILTLIQTHKIQKAPVILMDNRGDDFWKPFDAFVRNVMLHEDKVISLGDEKLYTITNDTTRAVGIVKANQQYCNH